MTLNESAAENSASSLPLNSVSKDKLGRYTMLMASLWTLVMAMFLTWNIKTHNHYRHDIVLHQARAIFEQILITRAWNAAHGGVYVPVTEETRPSPYLQGGTRDLLTMDGQKLTKINPAQMTRQIADIAAARNEVKFHITSLRPIRPENGADEWEQKALRSFGRERQEIWEKLDEPEGEVNFRYMAPLRMEESCLSCHKGQGYRVGDLGGGISITIPGKEIVLLHQGHVAVMSLTYLIIWLLGLGLFFVGYHQLKKGTDQRENLIASLSQALAEVKTLSGLLPICSTCKKIRDDKGYWNQIEVYVQRHSQTRFSHGICPDCLERLYPDISRKIKEDEENTPN